MKKLLKGMSEEERCKLFCEIIGQCEVELTGVSEVPKGLRINIFTPPTWDVAVMTFTVPDDYVDDGGPIRTRCTAE